MRSKTSETINPRIFKYLTPSMLLMVTAAAALVAMLWGSIWVNFQTNVSLNGLIFLVIFIGCIKIFHQNYRLFCVARFLRQVESSEDKDELSDDGDSNLYKQLKRNNYFLDSQKFQRALDNMRTYGYVQFSLHEADIIRAKMGRHIRAEKGIATYLAGILVMLGLIGTFWGLLITISSVGAAMGDVSQSMAVAGSGESMTAMSQFIDGISKPLQGMGIAFSSSLFGLTGSLFVGMLNFFAGQAQHRFMEDFTLWLNEHTPEVMLESSPPAAGLDTPQDKDLKAWIGAFIQLSAKANRRMNMVFSALTQLTEALNRQSQSQASVCQTQKELKATMSTVSTALCELKKSPAPTDAGQNFAPVLKAIETNSEQLRAVCEKLQTLSESNQAAQSEFQMKSNELSQISVQISAILQEIDQNNQSVHGKLRKSES